MVVHLIMIAFDSLQIRKEVDLIVPDSSIPYNGA
jgi:hypothetical protein